MNILYGVQGTGNGHISRARVMQQALAAHEVKVDFIFSGRAADQYFDMTAFGDFKTYQGLTFSSRAGQIDYLNTIKQLGLKQFMHDIRALDLSCYDLVLTDFEPISAWAAKISNKTCIGLGNQYAYRYQIPRCADSWLSRQILHWFAPARIALGNHWHHFDQPILPPLLQNSSLTNSSDPNQVLIYLPFEDAFTVFASLMPLKDYQFHFFSNVLAAGNYGHIQVHPLSRQDFLDKLRLCQSVLCNAGFELASEALQLGKRILLKPLKGQMEQSSNALALSILNYGLATEQLNSAIIADWLANSKPVKVNYPDVANAVVDWLLQQQWQSYPELAAQLWSQVTVAQLNTLTN